MAHSLGHRALFLASAQDWAHLDGTAAVRIHLALTDPDETGHFWAIKGSSQLKPRPAELVVLPDRSNRLRVATSLVVNGKGLVRLHRDQVIRTTGLLHPGQFSQLWDLIEAQGLAAA